MSFKKIIGSSVVAAAVASSVFAGTATNSTNGKGDYLVYPAYYATDWSTNIRVVNTSATEAYVAKVVVREYATSKELLDFPIYLSPNDVFTCDIAFDGNIARVSSTDDSAPEANMNVAVNNNNTAVGTQYGYVEVLAVAKAPATSITAAWTVNTPLAKSAIQTSYAAVTAAAHGAWVAPTADLFGQELISAATAGSERSMTLMATAQVVGLTAAEDLARDISKNSVFATDTQASSIWYALVDADLRTNMLKNNVYAVNYTNAANETQILLTQPLKHTNPDADATVVLPYFAATAAETTATQSVSKFYYVGRTWDESENTVQTVNPIYSGSVTTLTAETCLTEICYVTYGTLLDTTGIYNTAYANGWVNLTLGTLADGTGSTAVPTLATVISGTRVNGVGIVNAYTPAFQ